MALPTQHLTIECRMVEQKKGPPLTEPVKDGRWGQLESGRVASSLGPAATLPLRKIPQRRWRMEEKNPQQQAHLAAGGRGTGQRRLPVQEVHYMSEVDSTTRKAELGLRQKNPRGGGVGGLF
jgi:hypothetical protein